MELQIRMCGAGLWHMFWQYYYLSGFLVPHAHCYCAIYEGKPIAFIAVVLVHMGKVLPCHPARCASEVSGNRYRKASSKFHSRTLRRKRRVPSIF